MGYTLGMMYPTIEQLETKYRVFMSLKKKIPIMANQATLLNQQLLTNAGRIHQSYNEEQYRNFVQNTFVGAYYDQWRKERAVSIVNAIRIYDQLDVHFKTSNYRGETFYAGIPPITQAEVDAAKIAINNTGYKFWPISEKIGIDGEYHPVDMDGEFCPMLDENDIYGDNSGVTLDDLQI